jgi:hypothetical protein
VALEKDDVAAVVGVAGPEEVVEGDLIEGGGRGVCRDVPADPLFLLVRAHDHRQGVPPDEALDAPLDVGAARHEDLLVGRDGIDVGRIGGERQVDAVLGGVNRQLAQEPRDFCRSAALENVIEGLEPLACFDGVEFRCIFWSNVSHSLTHNAGPGSTAFRLKADHPL